MTDKQHPKVRFVKCPRCAKILPEPEHVPLYTCGGCNTILQAKNYRGSNKDTPLSSHEQNVTTSNGIIHARNGGESSGSSRRSSSSGEHLFAQDKERDQDAVENSSNSEQNGAANSSDYTSLSKESNFLKKNGQIDDKIDQSVLKDQNERRDWEAVKSCSYSEQNGAANSSNHIALLQESSFDENKQNGETDSKLRKPDQSLKEPNEGRNQNAVKQFSISEQKGAASSAHHTALSEESNIMENKDNGVIDQFHAKDPVSKEYPAALRNKETKQLTMKNSEVEDDNSQGERCNGIAVESRCKKQIGEVSSERETSTLEDSQVLRNEELQHLAMVKESIEDEDDQHKQKQVGYVNSAEDAFSPSESTAIENSEKNHASDRELSEETRKMHLVGKSSHQDQFEQKLVGYVNSVKDTSSLTESSIIKNPAEHDPSYHEVSNKTRKMHLLEKHPHQDQLEQTQVGYVKSAKGASSLTESSAIEKPKQLASETLAEYDAFDNKVSEETRKMHLLGKNCLQDVRGNEIKCLDAEKPVGGKEFGSGTDPKELVECTAERLESVKTSLSTEIFQGGNVDSVAGTEDDLEACGSHSLSSPSSATGLKTSCNRGTTTKASGDPHCGSNPLDNGKGRWKENPISPTKRSPAYDGSVSSFDGNDDQVPGQPIQISEETTSTNNANAGYDCTEGSPEWNNISSERRNYRRTRVQAQACSSSMLDEKLKRSMVEEIPLEESKLPRRFRPNRDSFLPRVPYRRSSEMTFEGSSSSYALHDEYPSHQMHHHSYRRRFPEAPLYREKDFHPMYYNYATSGEMYDIPKYHRAYHDRRRRTESWSHTLPRIPYSGEIFNGRYSYMHQYPDDRRWSAQLHPPAGCWQQGVYMPRWDPYDSYPTSPPQFVESESSCAWGYDTISDDQRQKDQIMRRLREKRQAVKRQFHPIAGGAPFLTCYFCFNVLQFPEGFLLSRRRNNKLQCGACSRILEFSLENEGCLAPCETDVGKNVNLAVSSNVNHSRRSSLNSADARELLARDSFGDSGREKRKLVAGSLRNDQRMEGLLDAASHAARGRESKVTWKMPARSKSPLHRLMGYSSPQDLLTGREDDDDVE